MKRAPIIPKIQKSVAAPSDAAAPAAPMVDSLLTRVGALAKGNSITIPVCGREVKFTLKVIPGYLVEKNTKVWDGNERDQDLLTEESLDDLIPSFLISGQQNPAYGRELGEYVEIADGSRRRKTAILTSCDYRVLVGDLDDEQMNALCNLGNNYRPTSAYERGIRYKKRLESMFSGNISALAEAEHISRKIITRCINTAALPRDLIALFSQPGELSARAGDELSKIYSRNMSSVLDSVKKLAIRKGQGEKLDSDTIIRALSNAGRSGDGYLKDETIKKVFATGAVIQYRKNKIILSLDTKKIPSEIMDKIEHVLNEYATITK